jgi:tetratricopeptide (TPR) repeat protein
MAGRGEARKGVLRWKATSTLCRPLAAIILAASLQVPAALAADPQLIYKQSVEALYNLDFNVAERLLTELTRTYPENPEYWTALASAAWLRILQDQQKLTIESFSGRDTFGTKDSKENVSQGEEARLREYAGRAIHASDAVLKKNPKDVHALYAKGAANATLASFEATIKRSYLAAGKKAKVARDLHRDVLRIDPEFHDAEMTIGIFNYIVGSSPGWARYTILLALGITGEGKDTGIRQLETAARTGKHAITDTKSLLVVVYTRERRYEDALRVTADLHSSHPRNFMYELTKASIYGKMKRWDSAIQTYHQIIEKIRSHKDAYDRLRQDKVYLELANMQIQSAHFEDAAETFKQVVASKEATPDERASAHLGIGRIYDTSNRRSHALQHYKAIQLLDCNPAIKEDARKYERKPFS